MHTPWQSHVHKLLNQIAKKLNKIKMITKFEYDELEDLRWIKWLAYVLIAFGLGLMIYSLICK